MLSHTLSSEVGAARVVGYTDTLPRGSGRGGSWLRRRRGRNHLVCVSSHQYASSSASKMLASEALPSPLIASLISTIAAVDTLSSPAKITSSAGSSFHASTNVVLGSASSMTSG